MDEQDDLHRPADRSDDKTCAGAGGVTPPSTDIYEHGGDRSSAAGALEASISRGRLLRTGVKAGLAAYVGVETLGRVGLTSAAQPVAPPPPTPATGTAAQLHHLPLRFFNDGEARTVAAMAERIFPADRNGPGATDARVADYIDGQLAEGWGHGDKIYLQGPFFVPKTSGHGWQVAMTPRDVYKDAIAAITTYCTKRYGKSFDQLTASAQDQVMHALEDGKVPMTLPSDQFFTLYRENVVEGLFADPIYGGNRDLVGWKWVRFPGDPMAYGDLYGYYIDKFNMPYNVAPRSLADQAY